MRFSQAIDLYVADMRAAGRINSDRSEVSYRATLVRHAEDVSNRDPSKINRADVKRTLARWEHPNTHGRAVLTSCPSIAGRWRKGCERTILLSRLVGRGSGPPRCTG